MPRSLASERTLGVHLRTQSTLPNGCNDLIANLLVNRHSIHLITYNHARSSLYINRVEICMSYQVSLFYHICYRTDGTVRTDTHKHTDEEVYITESFKIKNTLTFKLTFEAAQ